MSPPIGETLPFCPDDREAGALGIADPKLSTQHGERSEAHYPST